MKQETNDSLLTFFAVISILAVLMTGVYLGTYTALAWPILVFAYAPTLSAIAGLASTGLKKATPVPQSSSDGQGPKVNRFLAVAAIMLVISEIFFIVALNER